MIALGLTAEEGTEGLLEEVCEQAGIPCLHAWLELQGQVLRMFRVVPGRDPSYLDLATDPAEPLPPIPRLEQPAPARECADVVPPGSASNIHAAANFVVQVALELLTGHISAENHWLFSPSGIQHPELVPELAALQRRFGVFGTVLSRRGTVVPS